MSRTLSIIVYAFTVIFFAVFFIYPIFSTIKEAFFDDNGFTFSYIGEVFGHSLYLTGLLNSLKMAIFSTAAAVLLALPLAIISDRFQFPGKAILCSMVLVPLILPPFVGAIGVKQILGQEGSLNIILVNLGLMDAMSPKDWLGENRLFGVIIMNALHLYPIIYLNLTAALANIDPAMEEAAENLGASWWHRLTKITIPLTMPGLFAGCTIVFIWGFTELGVPLIFDYTRVTSVQIFDGIKDLSDNPLPYALVTVMLISTILIYLTSKFFFGKSNFSGSGRASMGKQARALPLHLGLLCTLAFGFVFFLAVLPHIGVILVSVSKDWYQTILPSEFTLDHYKDALGHSLVVPSISNSLKYASLATFVDVILGVLIAYVIVRTRLWGRQLLDAISMLPLAVPGLVLAFGYLAMTREGQPFEWLLPNDNPIWILVIAYAVRRLPYVVRSAAAGFQQTNVSLEEAAQNLGCPPAKTLVKITLPLIAANLIAGGLLAFSFAMLEVSDSLILAEKAGDFPITKAIYSLFSVLGNGHHLASALGVWAMVFLGVTIVGASIILGKKMGALFRV